MSLCEKRPDVEFFLVRIFLYSDWIQKKKRILTLFTQCVVSVSPHYQNNKNQREFKKLFEWKIFSILLLFWSKVHSDKKIKFQKMLDIL